MRTVAQHDCPWQSGSGESIWVRKDNPLTPKEDWRISWALMSCELVFISHHKNRAVCVTARALGHDQRVSKSIMGNCYCSGKSAGKRRGGQLRKREQEGLSAKVFWCLRSLSCHRSWGLERWCDNWGWPGQVYCSANEHPLSWVIISWNMMPKNSFA